MRSTATRASSGRRGCRAVAHARPVNMELLRRVEVQRVVTRRAPARRCYRSRRNIDTCNLVIDQPETTSHLHRSDVAQHFLQEIGSMLPLAARSILQSEILTEDAQRHGNSAGDILNWPHENSLRTNVSLGVRRIVSKTSREGQMLSVPSRGRGVPWRSDQKGDEDVVIDRCAHAGKIPHQERPGTSDGRRPRPKMSRRLARPGP